MYSIIYWLYFEVMGLRSKRQDRVRVLLQAPAHGQCSNGTHNPVLFSVLNSIGPVAREGFLFWTNQKNKSGLTEGFMKGLELGNGKPSADAKQLTALIYLFYYIISQSQWWMLIQKAINLIIVQVQCLLLQKKF